MQKTDDTGRSETPETVPSASSTYDSDQDDRSGLRLVEAGLDYEFLSLPLPARRQPITVRVLVVDDDEDEFRLTRQLLSRALDTRFESEWASGADQALSRLRQSAFDIVLVDYRMPRLSGLDFARKAQALGYRLPIILMSGSPDENTEYDALEMGLADYLDKEELDVGRLERRIRFALARENGLGRLGYLCHFDELTGLANRTLLNDRFARALAGSRRNRTRAAIIVVDLNRFKPINDSFGHAAGDRVLKTVAERMVRSMRETDTVARIGGDEFALIVDDLQGADDAVIVGMKIIETIGQPVFFEGKPIDVSAAVGISIYPDDAEDAETLLQLADIAMYRAKREPVSCCRFHDQKLDRRLSDGCLLEWDLKEAILHRRMVLECFSQRRLAANGTRRIDMSPTWPHPEYGPLPVSRFRRLAEQSGLVAPLMEWMVDAAVSQLREWRATTADPLAITFPLLSRRQIDWAEFLERLARKLRESGFDAGCVELAVCESMLLEESRAGGEAFAEFTRHGFGLAVDEFGSETGSLALLRDLPLTTVRLARGLLEHSGDDRHRQIFVDATIGLARKLGYEIVAPDPGDPDISDMLARAGAHAILENSGPRGGDPPQA
ncbi:MAG: diguanylate cyclase [Geminicoccaceae bacterium]